MLSRILTHALGERFAGRALAPHDAIARDHSPWIGHQLELVEPRLETARR
jgi:hypothetical protein